MHELGVTQDILKKVLAAVKKNATGVKSISITIGEYNQLVPENIEYYFGLLAKGTPAENAKLKISRTPVQAKCTSCGRTFRVEGFNFLCPDCGGFAGEIISGKELSIDSIVLAEEITQL